MGSDGMSTVREHVLDKVKPGKEQREDAEEVVSHILSFIADRFDRDADLMGSVAKNTELADGIDLDVFVFFPENVDEEDLEKEGLEIGEAVFNELGGDYHVEYADHPYTKGVIQGFAVEIVPAYDVSEAYKIKSAVDRTPFHKQWINKHLSKEEKDEVRLLKAFLTAHDLYGSTLKIQGFSGYLCEVLVAEYDSFKNVLEAAVEWDKQAVIDPANHYEGEQLPNYAWDKMEDDALIVVDPVDKERNVAAVLSEENLARFIHVAWQFLDQPSTDFFEPPQLAADTTTVIDELEQWGTWLTITFPAPDEIDDILYPQLRKIKRRLETELEQHDFTPTHTGVYADNEHVKLVFCFTDTEKPVKKKQYGPHVYHNTKHLQNFTDKYSRVWIEDSRLVTRTERTHQTPRSVLETFLDGDLKQNGVPDNLVPQVEDATIEEGLDTGSDAWERFLADTGGFLQ